MREFLFETEQTLSRPLSEVFDFFSDARNLSVITPPWLHFEVLTPGEIEMGVGTCIDYRLRVRGIPLRWQSEITLWEPPLTFVDVQRRGPYRLWRHRHTFAETESGVLVGDSVVYSVWGGGLVDKFFVSPDIVRIFSYRSARLAEIFGAESGSAD